MPDDPLSRFTTELRRRKPFRCGAACLAGDWVLQVLDPVARRTKTLPEGQRRPPGAEG